MHLPGVAELLFDGDCGGGLDEFSKPGTSIGKTPGRQLDIKIVERTMYGYFRFVRHASAFPVGR